MNAKQRAFDVFLCGNVIDTVFANGYDAEEMRRSLIEHDGYDPAIVVYRRSTDGKRLDDVAPKLRVRPRLPHRSISSGIG